MDHELLKQRLEEVWGYFPTLHEVQICVIETALKTAGGNQGVAASILGLKRQTLSMRLKALKMRQ